MFGTWTIGKKFYSGAATLGLCILLSGTSSWYDVTTSSVRFDDAVSRTHKVKGAADLKRLAFEMYGAEKIEILSGFDNDKKNYDTWAAKYQASYKELEDTTASLGKLIRNAEDKERLQKVAKLAQQQAEVNREVVALIDAGRYHEAQALSREKNRARVDETGVVMDALIKSQITRLEAEKVAGEAGDRQARATVIVLGLLSLAAIAGVIWLVRSLNKTLRNTVDELTSGSQQIVAAATQVAGSAQGLSQGSTEQAASLEETSASMEEMAAMTRQNAEHTKTAATLMAEVDTRVRASNEALGDMVTSMNSIQESSLKVGRIIKTIDEIAFQTNILALNAAVEAARAGEAGMGFAVVADEVRNLAQRSAQAAKDTAGLIEDSIASVKGGTTKVQQVAGAITGITESVSTVKGLVHEVSMASLQQTQGIDQVSQAIQQMEKVTQTTAATAEESAAASEELNAQAETSMQVVRQLEALVGHTSQVTVAPRRGRPQIVKGPRRAAEAIPLDDAPQPPATGTYGRF